MWQPEADLSVYEAILARRSVRSFSTQEIAPGKLKTLLEAAVCAPTAMHEEPWAFVIIEDQDKLRQLSERAKPFFAAELGNAGVAQARHKLDILTRPGCSIFYDAPALIVIGAIERGPFVVADCWLAAENLMLAACALGLGTCVIGSALPALNVMSVKAELGIPDSFFAIAPIVTGYPGAEDGAAPVAARGSRKAPMVLAHLWAHG